MAQRLSVLSAIVLGGVLGAHGDYLSETWISAVNRNTESQDLKGHFARVAVVESKMPMAFYVSRPPTREDSAQFPAVVVAHHAVGIYNNAFLRQFADDLAENGFVAVLPDFFHRVWNDQIPNGLGTPVDQMNIRAMLGSLQDAEILSDLTSIFSWMEKDAGIDSERVGVLGFCMGGRIAWLSAVEASFKDKVRAAVAYHGGNVFKGLGPGEVAPAERIPTSLNCPVLGHFGGIDKNPSPADMQKLKELAGEKLDAKVYPNADHGFSCKDSVKYLESAATEAWRETLIFLHDVLKTPKKRSGEL